MEHMLKYLGELDCKADLASISKMVRGLKRLVFTMRSAGMVNDEYGIFISIDKED